jgi:4-hydroxybenzoate polyprenyltransferase
VILLTGFPAIGLLLSTSKLSIGLCPNLLAFFLLFLSIYQLNAFFGYHQDLKNSRLGNLSKFSKYFYLKISITLLIFSLIILSINGPAITTMAFGIYLVWALYSLPIFGTKNYPLLGNLTHFIMGLAHFFLGYLINSEDFENPLYMGIYFSLLFTAGHLVHELIDFEADKSNGLRTSATFFGYKKVICFSQILFGCSFLYLLFLYGKKIIPLSFLIPFSAAYVISFFCFYKLNLVERFQNLLRYRKIYRYLYLLAGGTWIILWW